jgi:transcriptional regulator with GAF, ATPase, and Fis domain
MLATIEELTEQSEIAEPDLIGYRILYLQGRIAQLDAIAEHHWDELVPPVPIGNLHNEVNEFEKKHIVEALRATFGKREKAAKLLGTTRRALEYRCHQLGILEGGRKDVGSVKSSRRIMVPKVNNSSINL